jgi:hypothetical protein
MILFIYRSFDLTYDGAIGIFRWRTYIFNIPLCVTASTGTSSLRRICLSAQHSTSLLKFASSAPESRKSNVIILETMSKKCLGALDSDDVICAQRANAGRALFWCRTRKKADYAESQRVSSAASTAHASDAIRNRSASKHAVCALSV